MPGLTGMQLIRAVRAMDTSARFMPIIMLTGHSDLKHLYEARDAGVTEFLCKPVTAKAILGRLNAVIMEPRPFMISETYFGPDRRRTNQADYAGPLRRAGDLSRKAGVG